MFSYKVSGKFMSKNSSTSFERRRTIRRIGKILGGEKKFFLRFNFGGFLWCVIFIAGEEKKCKL